MRRGQPIPPISFATLKWTLERPIIQQRNRRPPVTVKSVVVTKDRPATNATGLQPAVDAIAASLPGGYTMKIDGSVESSAESQVPILLLMMVSLVMVQMQSFRRNLILLAGAPSGLIGVLVALLVAGAALVFVVILGVLALVGILIRNTIILVNAINGLQQWGLSRWQSVFDAKDSRARPILPTAAAASLALIPISRQAFRGAVGRCHDGRDDCDHVADPDVCADALWPDPRGQAITRRMKPARPAHRRSLSSREDAGAADRGRLAGDRRPRIP